MMSALFVGASGLKTHDQGLGVVGNNLANVNTIAYKQQEWLFQDLMYKDLSLGTSNTNLSNQQGMGSLHCVTRTLFTQGSHESTGNYTDLSINGTGFFKVQNVDNGSEYLTRAGDFIFDKEGFLIDPTGAQLLAYPIDQETGAEGALQALQLDVVNNAPVSAFHPTSSIEAKLNLGFTSNYVNSYETVTVPAPTPTDPDATTTEEQIVDPYFSLLKSYDATSSEIMPNVPYSQPMTVYDNEGNKHEITFHFDVATDENGVRTMEYIATIPPELDASGIAVEKQGVVMAGTMTFSSSGQLTDMSAFSPTGGDANDLSSWTAAELDENGSPIMNINFADSGNQQISINFGASSPSGWSNAGITAADVGTNSSLLPEIGVPADREEFASTSYPSSSSSIADFRQDGAPQGELSSISFGTDGTVMGHFTNGKTEDLYRIPVYRVTSQDGLYNEGNNHYTVTPDCGLEEEGIAGQENYGYILGSAIETSNVAMEREMVDLIILQRGFQSNSKSVTTADEMLQKAMELKRT